MIVESAKAITVVLMPIAGTVHAMRVLNNGFPDREEGGHVGTFEQRRFAAHQLGGETDVGEHDRSFDVEFGEAHTTGDRWRAGWELVEAYWVSERRGLARVVCEQTPYSIFAREPERDVFPVTQRYGMGVLVWSPLAGGWLTGKYQRGRPIPDDSRIARAATWGPKGAARYHLDRPGNQRKLDLLDKLAKIAEQAGLSLTHMAVAFTLVHPAVTTTILGPRTYEQLKDLYHRHAN